MLAPSSTSKRPRRPMGVPTPALVKPTGGIWKPRGPKFGSPNQMVTFIIGSDENQTPFSVHKGSSPFFIYRTSFSRFPEFACHYSPVLKAAFNSSFIEGETQTYRLEEVEKGAFTLLVQWFYTQDFDVFTEDDLADDKNPSEPEVIQHFARQELDLVQLWIVADKLLIPRLQNSAITKLQESWQRRTTRPVFNTSWFPYVYEHTTPGSPLRNLAVDICAFSLKKSDFLRNPENFPRELLLDYAVEMSVAIHGIDNGDDSGSDEDDSDYDSDSDGSEDDEDSEADASEYEINKDDEGHEVKEGSLKSEILRNNPPKYECVRTMRSYLVPEDEDEGE